MIVINSLNDYNRAKNKISKLIVISENCSKCEEFIASVYKCILKNGFVIAMLSLNTNFDDDLYSYFINNNILSIPFIVINGKEIAGDQVFLSKIICNGVM